MLLVNAREYSGMRGGASGFGIRAELPLQNHSKIGSHLSGFRVYGLG